MQTNSRLMDTQTRIIREYQKQNRSFKKRVELWKAEHVTRNVALFLGLIAGALLTNIVWIFGFNWFVLGR